MGIAPSTDRFLTVQECADLWHVHPETIRKWIRDGILPHVHIGRRCIRVEFCVVESFGRNQLRQSNTT